MPCTDGCVNDLELLWWTVNDVTGRQSRKVQGLQPFKNAVLTAIAAVKVRLCVCGGGGVRPGYKIFCCLPDGCER